MKSLRHRPLAADGLIAACALLLTALYVIAGGGGFALDDAWIHQTYGRNLGLTGLWAFVPGVPSAASTSPLYTILLAVGYALRIPFALWTHGLGAAALAGTGLLARRLAVRAAPELRGVGLAAGLACVFSWHLIWAAASGMETALFAMWTLALILLAWREIDAQRPRPWLRAVIFGAVAACATLTRPEGVLLAGLCGIALLLARPNRSLQTMAGWLVISGSVWLLLMLPYFASNLQLAGSLLPSTNAAKVVALSIRYGLPLSMRFAQITSAMLAGAQLLLMPGVVFYSFRFLRFPHRSSSSALFLVPVAWALALPVLYSIWMPFWEQHGRYVIPAIPSLVMAGVVGSLWLLKGFRENRVMRVLSTTLVMSAWSVLVAFAFLLGLAAYQKDVILINQEMVDPAQWIAENLPADDLLAAHDIGAIGFFAPRPLLDTAGLVTPETVPFLFDGDGMFALMERLNVRYFVALSEYVPVTVDSHVRLCPLYRSPGSEELVIASGGSKMVVYLVAWDGVCPPES